MFHRQSLQSYASSKMLWRCGGNGRSHIELSQTNLSKTWYNRRLSQKVRVAYTHVSQMVILHFAILKKSIQSYAYTSSKMRWQRTKAPFSQPCSIQDVRAPGTRSTYQYISAMDLKQDREQSGYKAKRIMECVKNVTAHMDVSRCGVTTWMWHEAFDNTWMWHEAFDNTWMWHEVCDNMDVTRWTMWKWNVWTVSLWLGCCGFHDQVNKSISKSNPVGKWHM